MKPTLSILMPAFREGRVLAVSLARVHQAARDLRIPFEIVVVDDGSPDRTFAVARHAASVLPGVVALRLERNGGKGAALRAAFERSRGWLVAFLDADLDLDPARLAGLLAVRRESGADVVVGSKLHPASVVGSPFRRRIASAGFRLISHSLLRLPAGDTQTGLKLFRREVLDRTFPRLATTGFAFDVELLLLAAEAGFRVVEAPVTIRYRGKDGHIGAAAILGMARELGAIAGRARARERRRSAEPAA